jgi:Flp pilus assembly protein TadD
VAPTDTSSAPDPERDAAALFARALLAQDAGDDATATALLRKVITLTPDRAAPHTNLGILLRRAGRLDDAVREYETAIRLDPADAAAYHNLGLIHRSRGAFAEAERAYARALELRPNQADTHYNLGILYELYLNRPQDALTHYRAVVTLGSPDANTIAGWIRTLERRAAQDDDSRRDTGADRGGTQG